MAAPRTTIHRTFELSAGRQLAGAREIYGDATRPHGHDFLLEVGLRGDIDALHGMVLNFDVVKREVHARILDPLGGRRLDRDVPELAGRPATLEHLARIFLERLSAQPAWLPAGAAVAGVRLVAPPATWVDDRGGSTMELTRRFHFAASHRLFTPALDEAANRELYGKCAHPSGHGHNYALEVTVEGEVDPVTGLVMSGVVLSELVAREVLARLDHTHMNLDHVDLFAGRVPTAENICAVAWELLAPSFAAGAVRLARLRLGETRDCFVDYLGP